MVKIFLFLSMLLSFSTIQSQEKYELKENIPYLPAGDKEGDAYRLERCKLDLYYPSDKKGFATVVYFHGGGLEGGEKEIPAILRNQSIAVAAPGYRLSPRAQHPAYLLDAAEAVRWTRENIARYGGDPDRIYVAGHSAGGYLTLMLALDTTYLADKGIPADSLAGYVSLSGQTNTHYTIRKERGDKPVIPVIDRYAPLYHARKLSAPLLLVTGDRNKELLARYTENLHLQDILREMGNPEIKLYELNGFDHGTMIAPGCLLLLEMIEKENK